MRNIRQLTTSLLRHFFWFGALVLTFTAASQQALAGATVTGQISVPGQASTRLPDGRWLLSGGIRDGGTVAALSVYDPIAVKSTTLKSRLNEARAYHTATLLPDGRILIFGGVGTEGSTVSSAEVLDVASDEIQTLPDPGLLARSHHTATLMTDGKLLIVGGLSTSGDTVDNAELWDPRTGNVSSVGRGSSLERSDTVGQLLADGNVLFLGGRNRQNNSLNKGLLFHADSQKFEEISVADSTRIVRAADSSTDLVVSATIPPGGASDFLPGGIITLRFSHPVDVRTVNTDSVVLLGPNGIVAGTVGPSQDGMLAFFIPKADLFPATRYTIFIKGIKDERGQELSFDSVAFNTASLAPGMNSRSGGGSSVVPSNATNPLHRNSTEPIAEGVGVQTLSSHASVNLQGDQDDDEIFVPGPKQEGGRWRTGRDIPKEIASRRNLRLTVNLPNSYENERKDRKVINERAAKNQVSRLTAEAVSSKPGVSGQVLRLNDKPLQNAQIRIGNQRVLTDAEGNFLLTGIPAGHHELLVDGPKSGVDRQFANFVIGINVDAKGVATVPPIYLPAIRNSDWIPIASPLAADTVVIDPKIPGMEIRIPKGTVLRDHDGKLVTRIALVPIPLDRMPFSFPENAPVYVSIQPAGMVVQGLTPGITKGIQVIYPNATNASPGTSADFWRYDAGQKGWYVYGNGRASADGKKIVPDAGVALYDSVGFMYTLPNPPPPPTAPPCKNVCPCATGGGGPAQGGDPVDLASGLFIHYSQYASLNDILPVSVTGTYRPGDPTSRAFGFGNSHPYAIYLREVSGTPTRYEQYDLVLPNGASIRYYRTAGNTYNNVVAEPRDLSPCEFSNSVFAYVNGQYIVTKKDGARYAFSLYGRLESISDRYGNIVNVASSTGQILRLTTQAGRYIDFTYDASNRVKTITDLTGRVWSYTYDAAGLLAQVTFPDMSTEIYTYDASGRMVTVQDRRGNTMVSNVYDTSGRVTQQTLADGGIYRFAYTTDTSGNITQTDVTDPRGNIRRVTFHSTGYPLTDTQAYGTSVANTVAYERSADGQLSAETDSLGRRTVYTYDAKGNTTSVTRLAGTAAAVTETFTYEPSFNLPTRRTDALGNTTTMTYDTVGNLTKVTDPLGNVLKFTYNGSGQPLSVTDPVGNVTQLAYDLGDLVSVTDPLNRTTTRYTDTLGRLVTTTDPLGNRTTYSYDVLGRIATVSDPQANLTQYAYDPLGNLLSVTDAKGNKTNFSYDNRNRLISRADPLLASETYQYDGLGNLTRYTDRKGQISTYAYDALNRRITASFADSSTVSYSYDAGSRLTKATDSLTGAVSRTYDDLDRLTGETTPQGSVSYSFDAAGRRTGMTVAGQPGVSYTFDAAGRLTQIQKGADSVSFTYDAAGRRIGLGLPNGIAAAYSYDAASQLTGISYTRPDASLIGNLSYSYDALGRRTGTSGSLAASSMPAAASATYDAANRLSSWNTAAITYDANGNMLSDGSRSYSWDARNQLAGITGAASASFQYDAFGRRIAKTVNGVQTGFLYDGLNPVQELNGATPTANLLTGLNIDEYYRRTDTTGARDILTNALGSVIALTDSLAQVKTQYTYSPYGETTASGEANANALQYTGRENDGTGLYFYRARYYNPGIGRFISEDPLGFEAGINFYAYVDGDPISNTDPEGLLLTALHAVQRGTTMNAAMQSGAIGNAAAAAGATAAATTATAAAAAAGVGAAGAAAMCTPTGRALTAAGLQALSTAQRAGGLPIPQGLGGTAPTSQSALINAIRQSTSAANQAARNNPAINRPTFPR